jgi:hypothetical protein
MFLLRRKRVDGQLVAAVHGGRRCIGLQPPFSQVAALRCSPCRHSHTCNVQQRDHGVQDLARWCWAQDPGERPTFSQIAKFLCLLLEEEESSRGPPGYGKASNGL